MGRPIGDKHSIEVATCIAAHEKPFSHSSLNALETLKETLSSEYPIFSPVHSVELKLEGTPNQELPPQIKTGVSGFSLQTINKETNKPTWAIRANENVAEISCFDYDRWGSSSAKALKDLSVVLSTGADEQNPLIFLALRVVDRFIGPSQEAYQLNQIFNLNSRFLTKQVKQAGALWHVHQGWFESKSEFKGRFLNVLNLSTNETPAGIITTIEHTIRYHSDPEALSSSNNSEAYLRSIFDILHEYNKQTIRDLLNAKQLTAIGLK